MSGRVGLLSVILAVQLLVIAGVLLTESGFGEREEGPFLDFDAAAVDEIRITAAAEGEAEEPETVTLTRGEDGWRLPDGLPADADKVSDVLDKLAGLRSPWPVATSAGAAERFEVDEDGFQRRVVLSAGGDPVADLYLGTSPGYQQVHARRADARAVYSVGLSNYQLPVAAGDWLDKALLQPRGEVTGLAREGSWRLSRGDDGWRLDETASGGESESGEAADSASADPATPPAVDQEAAGELVRRVSELRVTGPAEAPEAGTEPDAVLMVTDEQGTYGLSLVGDEEGNRYRIRSDRRDDWFGLAGYTADNLLVERDGLLAADTAATSAGEGGETAGDAGNDTPAAQTGGS